jgi:hypothetical protein
LRCNIQFDLEEISRVNYLAYSPYGMDNNVNHPVRVVEIQTSINGTDWDPVHPDNVWVATNQNLQSLRTSDNLSIGNTAWTFGARNVRFIRIYLEQAQTMDTKIGHLYYEEVPPFGQSAKPGPPTRAEGPIPTLDRPRRYYDTRAFNSRKLVQKTEVLQGKKWGIGIKDIEIQQIKYDKESSMVSRPIYVPSGIDRVSLDADLYVPEEFESQYGWIDFFVSVNNGERWDQISRVSDDHLGIPEIIAFNDPIPKSFREPGVLYIEHDGKLDSIRVKIVMRRPGTMPWSTPVVKSYSLRVKTR